MKNQKIEGGKMIEKERKKEETILYRIKTKIINLSYRKKINA